MDTILDSTTQELLDIIRWTPSDLAAALEINLRTAQRFASGQNETPDNVLEWLRTLAMAHMAYPLPIGWSVK